MKEEISRQCDRSRAISLLMANDPMLLDFILKPCRTALCASPARLLREARCFSSGQQILVRTALDIWGDYGRVKLTDIVFRLDLVRLSSFLLAVEFLGFSSMPWLRDQRDDRLNRPSHENI